MHVRLGFESLLLHMNDPFDLIRNITFTDTSGGSLFDLPAPGSFRSFAMLMTAPKAMGMNDHEALDYAESLGFTPDMF